MKSPWEYVVKTLIEELTAAGCAVVGVDDGEGVVRKMDGTEAIAAICGVDESHLYVKTTEGKEGWLFIVLGNEPEETVCDYLVYPVIETAVEKFEKRWEGLGLPVAAQVSELDAVKSLNNELLNALKSVQEAFAHLKPLELGEIVEDALDAVDAVISKAEGK